MYLHRGGVRRGKRNRNRAVPVLAHCGPAEAMLRRHRQEARRVAGGGHRQRDAFVRMLLDRVGDSRNLYLAWKHLQTEGGQAPGPDGVRFTDLEKQEVWAWTRAVGKAIREGTYRPGPDREVRIPKASGQGTRTLRISSIFDRVVQRAIVQILEPVIGPLFSPGCIGYRPGRGQHHGLARAQQLGLERRLPVRLSEDISNAFDHVPQRRLLQILGKYLPCDRLRQLLEAIVVTKEGRGIRQGGSLSPFCLNVYLHHVLDRCWRSLQPGTELLRFADDILVLCSNAETAEQARACLENRLRPAGMHIKETQGRTIQDLSTGESSTWLGHQVQMCNGVFHYNPAEKGWSNLTRNLEEAHLDPLAPLVATQQVEGWLRYLGACYRREQVAPVLSRVQTIAASLSFEEIPGPDRLESIWKRAHRQWLKVLAPGE